MHYIHKMIISIATTSLLACATPAPGDNRQIGLVERHSTCESTSKHSKAINEKTLVLLNGIQQWVTIKGSSCDNPVVLIVHGGPGKPLSPYHDSLFKNFEESFTVVHWDQRGSGKTYAANLESGELTMEKLTNAHLSIDLLVNDGLSVTHYVKRRLGKDKVIISGSSWGSFLATKMVHKTPDLYHFYVGLSQLVNGSKNMHASYQKVKDIAAKRNDQVSVHALERIGPPNWQDPRSFGQLRRIIRQYENSSVNQLIDWKIAERSSSESSKSARLFAEEFSFLKFVGLKGDGMLWQIALDECCNQLRIPVFLIQGEKDLLTTPEVTKAYYQKLSAPVKEYIPLPSTGHDPTQEMQETYLATLKKAAKDFIINTL